MENFFGADMPMAGRALITVGILAVLIVAVVIQQRRHAAREREAARRYTSIAKIREEIEFTSAGGLCIALLVVGNIYWIATFAASNTVLQQTVTALLWIGGNVLFGLGAALGRRRTYTVFRDNDSYSG